MIRRLIVLLLLALPLTAAAQFDDAIEQWVEEHGSDAGVAEMSDLFMQLVENPVNLNDTVGMASLPFLSPFQVRALRNYITLYGQFVSVKELHLVPGFDSLTVALILPMVKAEPYEKQSFPGMREMLRRGRHTLTTGVGGTVEQAKGYENGKYEGDNLRGLLCYRFNYDNHVQLQLSADKDPTEVWGKDNFLSYSLMVSDLFIGRAVHIEKLVLGRFNVQFGQGVTMWTGYEPFSLTGNSPVRFAGGVKTASPFYEEGWQEGFAATVGFGRKVSVSVFGSRAEDEWLGGGHVEFRHGNLVLGLTATASFLDDSVRLRNYVYNQDYFRGDRAGALGVDALWQVGRLLFFGELATDAEGHPAAIGGMRLTLWGDNSIGIAVRHYEPCYHNLHTAAYSIGSRTANEQGVSLDGRFRLPLGVAALVSADVHRFPKIRYGCYAPSTGSKWQLQLGHAVGPKGEATVRYTLRHQQRNVPGTSGKVIENTLRQQLQGQYRFTSGPWRFTTRAILSWFNTEESGHQQGWAVSQEARYNQGRWQTAVQVTWHDINGYYARIYLSESYIQYAYSLPMLQGRGLRTSAVVRCDLTHWLNLSFKYTLAFRPGEDHIGSDNATTPGPVRQTWHLQLRYKL